MAEVSSLTTTEEDTGGAETTFGTGIDGTLIGVAGAVVVGAVAEVVVFLFALTGILYFYKKNHVFKSFCGNLKKNRIIMDQASTFSFYSQKVPFSFLCEDLVSYDSKIDDFFVEDFMQCYFVPFSIKTLFRTTVTKQYNYKWHVRHTHVSMNLSVFCQDDLIEKYDILKIIHLINSFIATFVPSSKEKMLKHIYLFPSSITKKMIVPNKDEIWSPDLINSGYCSYLNGQTWIVVFRYEEMVKVLFHELIHAYAFDFHEEPTYAIEYVRTHFRISFNFVRFFEAYVEFWALCLQNYVIHDSNVSMNKEKEHCVRQIARILHHSGFRTWEEFYNKDGVFLSTNRLWKQSTDLFSYMVVKVVFLWNRNVQKLFSKISYLDNQIPFDRFFTLCQKTWQLRSFASAINKKIQFTGNAFRFSCHDIDIANPNLYTVL